MDTNEETEGRKGGENERGNREEHSQGGNKYQRLAEPTKGSTVASSIDGKGGTKVEIRVGSGPVGRRLSERWGMNERRGDLKRQDHSRGDLLEQGGTISDIRRPGEERTKPWGFSRTDLWGGGGQDDATVEGKWEQPMGNMRTTAALQPQSHIVSELLSKSRGVEAKEVDLDIKSDYSEELLTFKEGDAPHRSKESFKSGADTFPSGKMNG